MKKTVRYVQLGVHAYKVTEWEWKGPAGSTFTSRTSEKLIKKLSFPFDELSICSRHCVVRVDDEE